MVLVHPADGLNIWIEKKPESGCGVGVDVGGDGMIVAVGSTSVMVGDRGVTTACRLGGAAQAVIKTIKHANRRVPVPDLDIFFLQALRT